MKKNKHDDFDHSDNDAIIDVNYNDDHFDGDDSYSNKRIKQDRVNLNNSDKEDITNLNITDNNKDKDSTNNNDLDKDSTNNNDLDNASKEQPKSLVSMSLLLNSSYNVVASFFDKSCKAVNSFKRKFMLSANKERLPKKKQPIPHLRTTSVNSRVKPNNNSTNYLVLPDYSFQVFNLELSHSTISCLHDIYQWLSLYDYKVGSLISHHKNIKLRIKDRFFASLVTEERPKYLYDRIEYDSHYGNSNNNVYDLLENNSTWFQSSSNNSSNDNSVRNSITMRYKNPNYKGDEVINDYIDLTSYCNSNSSNKVGNDHKNSTNNNNKVGNDHSDSNHDNNEQCFYFYRKDRSLVKYDDLTFNESVSTGIYDDTFMHEKKLHLLKYCRYINILPYDHDFYDSDNSDDDQYKTMLDEIEFNCFNTASTKTRTDEIVVNCNQCLFIATCYCLYDHKLGKRYKFVYLELRSFCLNEHILNAMYFNLLLNYLFSKRVLRGSKYMYKTVMKPHLYLEFVKKEVQAKRELMHRICVIEINISNLYREKGQGLGEIQQEAVYWQMHKTQKEQQQYDNEEQDSDIDTSTQLELQETQRLNKELITISELDPLTLTEFYLLDTAKLLGSNKKNNAKNKSSNKAIILFQDEKQDTDELPLKQLYKIKALEHSTSSNIYYTAVYYSSRMLDRNNKYHSRVLNAKFSINLLVHDTIKDISIHVVTIKGDSILISREDIYIFEKEAHDVYYGNPSTGSNDDFDSSNYCYYDNNSRNQNKYTIILASIPYFALISELRISLKNVRYECYDFRMPFQMLPHNYETNIKNRRKKYDLILNKFY